MLRGGVRSRPQDENSSWVSRNIIGFSSSRILQSTAARVCRMKLGTHSADDAPLRRAATSTIHKEAVARNNTRQQRRVDMMSNERMSDGILVSVRFRQSSRTVCTAHMVITCKLSSAIALHALSYGTDAILLQKGLPGV